MKTRHLFVGAGLMLMNEFQMHPMSMYFRMLLRFLTSSPEEMRYRKLSRVYLRFLAVSIALAAILYPFYGLISSLIASSQGAFLLLVLVEVAWGRQKAPDMRKNCYACKVITYLIMVVGMSIVAALTALTVLNRTLVPDHDTLLALAYRYITLPFMLNVSIHSIRQMRP